ncbi:MAG: hypothetical protein JWL97_3844 [Gemmatimonadales bacterium]|jgi:hypothetical protein|nr:hypothetical protein [Gemmatimonadales bacterium]
MIAAAAGRDQAALVVKKIAGLVETPELRGAATVGQYRVTASRSGVMLDVISSDLATS